MCRRVAEQLKRRRDRGCQHICLYIGGDSVAWCQHLALEDQHSRTQHLWNEGLSLILAGPMMPKKDIDIGDM